MIIYRYTEPDMKVSSVKECKHVEKKGVYVFRDKHNKPLYVGKAHFFPSRMSDYISGNHHLHFNPNEEVGSIDLYFIEDEEMRVAYEYFLINYLNPTYNTAKVNKDGRNICIDKEGLLRGGLKDDVDFIDEIEKVYINKFVRLAKRYRIASNNLRRTNQFKDDINILKDEVRKLNKKNTKLIAENMELNKIVNSFKQESFIEFERTVNFSKNMEKCISLTKECYRKNQGSYKSLMLSNFFDAHDNYKKIQENIDFTTDICLQFTPKMSLGNIICLIKFLNTIIHLNGVDDIGLIYKCINELMLEYNIFVRKAYVKNVKKFNI